MTGGERLRVADIVVEFGVDQHHDVLGPRRSGRPRRRGGRVRGSPCALVDGGDAEQLGRLAQRDRSRWPTACRRRNGLRVLVRQLPAHRSVAVARRAAPQPGVPRVGRVVVGLCRMLSTRASACSGPASQDVRGCPTRSAARLRTRQELAKESRNAFTSPVPASSACSTAEGPWSKAPSRRDAIRDSSTDPHDGDGRAHLAESGDQVEQRVRVAHLLGQRGRASPATDAEPSVESTCRLNALSRLGQERAARARPVRRPTARQVGAVAAEVRSTRCRSASILREGRSAEQVADRLADLGRALRARVVGVRPRTAARSSSCRQTKGVEGRDVWPHPDRHQPQCERLM